MTTLINSKEIIAQAIHNSRKFEDNDVTSELAQAGLAYLKDYDGNFEYLVQLKTINPDNLSTGQIRGILNSGRAEILRANNLKDAPVIPNGRYAIDIEGKLRFFRVNSPESGKWSGFTFVNEIIGGGFAEDRGFSIKGGFKATVISIIGDDPKSAMARYGLNMGRCGVCNRDLTDEESRLLGIGPVCRNKF